jgi:hypothetical protein
LVIAAKISETLKLFLFRFDFVDFIERVRAEHHQRKRRDNHQIADLINCFVLSEEIEV